MKLLEGEHIRLRALEPEDLDLLYQWENDPDNWFVSNTLIPYSKHVLKEFIRKSAVDLYQNRQLRLMIIAIANNRPVGAIDLFEYDPYHSRAGVGILIHDRSDRNRGFASEALLVFKKYCFEHLHMHQLYCNIAAHNEASLKVFSRNGFMRTAEKKDWLRTRDGFSSEILLQCINVEDQMSS